MNLMKKQFAILTYSIKVKNAKQFLLLTRISLDPRLRGTSRWLGTDYRLLLTGRLLRVLLYAMFLGLDTVQKERFYSVR